MKVAIIGAGIAGLTAARELQQRGMQVEVFEKSRGLGGRLTTKRLDWGTLDTGAQYITARDPRFVQQVAQWQAGNIVQPWPFIPYVVTADALTASPDNTLRYVGVPGMNSPAHALAADLVIHRDTRIDNLEYSDQRWTLVAATGERFVGYDWTVLSLPAEQSADLLKGSSAIAEHIPKHILQPCWALVLATTGAVPAAIQGIFGDATVGWVSRLSAKPQHPPAQGYDDLWLLHFASEWSTQHGKQTEVDVVKAGYDWLRATLNKAQPVQLRLMKSYQHYWRYARMGAVAETQQTLVDEVKRVGVIGDWSCGGRVEGAYLSAIQFVDNYFS